MSKLLDLMERIRSGSPAPMGFGAARAGSVPGMVLVGLVSENHAEGVKGAAAGGVDAVMVSGVNDSAQLKDLATSLAGIPWGTCCVKLTEDESQTCQDSGGELVAFALEGTTAAAITGEADLARILSVASNLEDSELRAISGLPVDALVLDMSDVSGPWTLQDLVNVGANSRRTDKYILVQVSNAPGGKDLEALRDMGVSGLILDLSAVSPEALAGLKAALLAMPRSRSRRRDRMRATVPGMAFSAAPTPEREDDDDDDDDFE